MIQVLWYENYNFFALKLISDLLIG